MTGNKRNNSFTNSRRRHRHSIYNDKFDKRQMKVSDKYNTSIDKKHDKNERQYNKNDVI